MKVNKMDVYTERTIKLMEKNKFGNYLKAMTDLTMPEGSMITLIYLKVKEFEEAANKEILDEAMARKAEHERRRLADG